MDLEENPFQKISLQRHLKRPNALLKPQYPYEAEHLKLLSDKLKILFPHTHALPLLHFSEKATMPLKSAPLRIGVLFSGGQAPGGHNVLSGIFDQLQQGEENGHLYGFLNGPKGLIDNDFCKVTATLIASYRNEGGFDLLGSSRTKIETREQFAAVEKTARDLKLDGIIIIGGDDSNTNAAVLAEYFLAQECPTRVIGVPKTIDGDLKNHWLEISFGFDTAAKTYSALIGNIARDALSSRKYYHFVKLMGRSASHLTLECALQTHPNMALISEEIAEEKKSLSQITTEIAELIEQRSSQGKEHGIILIPEGILEFIPEVKQLITELNGAIGTGEEPGDNAEKKVASLREKLSQEAEHCLDALPPKIQQQLLLDRDPHGNVQLSKIDTEQLLIEMVASLLKKRRDQGKYRGKFSAQAHFFGYEGRSCYPSNFDANYCYSLGQLAAMLVAYDLSGYMAALKNLAAPVEQWQLTAIPLVPLMAIEKRHGNEKAVIKKSLVELKSPPFITFKKQSLDWAIDDCYRFPAPIHNFGPTEICDAITMTMAIEAYELPIKEVNRRDLEHAKRI